MKEAIIAGAAVVGIYGTPGVATEAAENLRNGKVVNGTAVVDNEMEISIATDAAETATGLPFSSSGSDRSIGFEALLFIQK